MDGKEKVVEAVVLEALAARLAATEPDVQRFVDLALGEIRRLSTTLAFTEHLNRQLEATAAEADERLARLGALLEEQAEQRGVLEAQLSRIHALCELADWSVGSAGVGPRPAVLVDDVRRALSNATET